MTLIDFYESEEKAREAVETMREAGNRDQPSAAFYRNLADDLERAINEQKHYRGCNEFSLRFPSNDAGRNGISSKADTTGC
jgi:hypothetical protein